MLRYELAEVQADPKATRATVERAERAREDG